jgi:hypothetical protein
MSIERIGVAFVLTFVFLPIAADARAASGEFAVRVVVTTDAGEPLGRVPVAVLGGLAPEAALTDANGLALIPVEVSAGALSLLVSIDERTPWRLIEPPGTLARLDSLRRRFVYESEQIVEIDPLMDHQRVEFVLMPGARVLGYVEDRQSRPRSAIVGVRGTGLRVPTDPDREGRFELTVPCGAELLIGGACGRVVRVTVPDNGSAQDLGRIVLPIDEPGPEVDIRPACGSPASPAFVTLIEATRGDVFQHPLRGGPSDANGVPASVPPGVYLLAPGSIMTDAAPGRLLDLVLADAVPVELARVEIGSEPYVPVAFDHARAGALIMSESGPGLASVSAGLSVDSDAPVAFPHPLITEILYAVPTGDNGDANADGERQVAGDEFIELVNPHPAPIDLGGYTLSDANAPGRGRMSFRFPDLTLPPGGVVVVFNGHGCSWSGPVGDAEHAPASGNDNFAGAWVLSMGNRSQRVGLANAGEHVLLADPEGDPIMAVVWGKAEAPQALLVETAPATSGGSIERLDAWRKHPSVDGVRFSPGRRPDERPGS